MYNSSDVAERIKYVAKGRGLTMKVVLEEAGLSFNVMTNMRSSMPNSTTLAKLADRLECSVDFLLGRTEIVTTAGTEQQTFGLPEGAGELLGIFRQLPEMQRVLLLGQAQGMLMALSASEAPPAETTDTKAV